jgi:hypothetical protein
MKVLVANEFLFNGGGAETMLFQERAFLTNTGTEVIDLAMGTSGISNRRTRRIFFCLARSTRAISPK